MWHFYDRLTLGCSHWWEFVNEECHNVRTFSVATSQPLTTTKTFTFLHFSKRIKTITVFGVFWMCIDSLVS